MTGDDPGEHVAQVGFRIDAIHLAGLDERSNDGPMFTTPIRSCKKMILPAKCHRPFILPMSGKSWKSITGGTRTLATRSAYGAWSNERQVDFLKFWDRSVSSFRSPIGCSIPWSALE